MKYLSILQWSAVLVLLSACHSSGNGGSGGPDPLFTDQWHLKNTGQSGADGAAAKVGEDINVEPVWNSCGTAATCRGEGIVIAVVDDGIEILHEDLAPNVTPGLSYNYLDFSTNPTPPGTAAGDLRAHGTEVSGIIAARDLNNVGLRGVASRASLVGFNMLLAQSISNEADAMIRGSPGIHISSNSWGPFDGRGLLDESSMLWQTAIDSGLGTGRNGNGEIYVWAGGNGATGSNKCFACVDNSNYDGFANYHGIIAVAAVTDQGTKASYSERGANILVSAPSGEFCNTHTISTTDRTGTKGRNPDSTSSFTDYDNQNYTKCMNGTSAATPVVSGVVALVLQANTNLGWRDVRAILATTARVNDPTNADWLNNGAGFAVNHSYGFGVVNADAAVTAAKTWVNLAAEKTHASPLNNVNLSIPDNNMTGVASTMMITGSNITEIESVEITFSSDHTISGDLQITLTNITTGSSSQLSEVHNCVSGVCTVYSAWVFSSVRHFKEAADGDWRLTVQDLNSGNTGNFQSWQLTFYGT